MQGVDGGKDLIQMQVAALSRVNFVYKDLRENPPLKWVPGPGESKIPPNVEWYLKRESLVESKMMLIVNYLCALLVKSKNNKISIYKNFQDRMEEINEFTETHKKTIEKIKTLRDKVYSHLDTDWLKSVENVGFDEIEDCINFLNKLFREALKKENGEKV